MKHRSSVRHFASMQMFVAVCGASSKTDGHGLTTIRYLVTCPQCLEIVPTNVAMYGLRMGVDISVKDTER